MLGLMQEWPLLCHKIIDYAATQHGAREIVTRSVEGPITRTNYREIRDRALRLAQALDHDGFQIGDRIATLGWNTARHMECWYGIMGVGGVYHTLNPRLFPEQIAWIMNHAEDRALFTDLSFLPIVEAIADKVPSLRKIIVLTDADHMPKDSKLNLVCYESWLAEADGDFSGLHGSRTVPGQHTSNNRRRESGHPRRAFATGDRLESRRWRPGEDASRVQTWVGWTPGGREAAHAVDRTR